MNEGFGLATSWRLRSCPRYGVAVGAITPAGSLAGQPTVRTPLCEPGERLWRSERTIIRTHLTGRKHSPEQIIRKLREADQLAGQGQDVAAVARALAISEAALHRW